MLRDGPLTRRPREAIRYGTGRCALGALLVATSEKGIVSIMVRDTPARLVRDIAAPFHKAQLVRDEKGGKATVAKVARYIAAPFRPFPLPLGSQDPVRQDLDVFDQLVLAQLLCLRCPLPSRAAHRRDPGARAGIPAVRMGRV